MKKQKTEAAIRSEQEFYTKCGELLHIEHEYHVPFPKKTRWNNRVLGNGRYKGWGTIQIFGPIIRIMCKKGTFVFETFEDVYDFLR